MDFHVGHTDVWLHSLERSTRWMSQKSFEKTQICFELGSQWPISDRRRVDFIRVSGNPHTTSSGVNEHWINLETKRNAPYWSVWVYFWALKSSPDSLSHLKVHIGFILNAVDYMWHGNAGRIWSKNIVVWPSDEPSALRIPRLLEDEGKLITIIEYTSENMVGLIGQTCER